MKHLARRSLLLAGLICLTLCFLLVACDKGGNTSDTTVADVTTDAPTDAADTKKRHAPVSPRHCFANIRRRLLATPPMCANILTV